MALPIGHSSPQYFYNGLQLCCYDPTTSQYYQVAPARDGTPPGMPDDVAPPSLVGRATSGGMAAPGAQQQAFHAQGAFVTTGGIPSTSHTSLAERIRLGGLTSGAPRGDISARTMSQGVHNLLKAVRFFVLPTTTFVGDNGIFMVAVTILKGRRGNTSECSPDNIVGALISEVVEWSQSAFSAGNFDMQTATVDTIAQAASIILTKIHLAETPPLPSPGGLGSSQVGYAVPAQQVTTRTPPKRTDQGRKKRQSAMEELKEEVRIYLGLSPMERTTQERVLQVATRVLREMNAAKKSRGE